MYCKNCGSKIEGNISNCPNCGMLINNQSFQSNQNINNINPNNGNINQNYSNNVNNNKSNNNKTIIIGAIIIILVLLIAIFFMMNKDNDNKLNNDNDNPNVNNDNGSENNSLGGLQLLNLQNLSLNYSKNEWTIDSSQETSRDKVLNNSSGTIRISLSPDIFNDSMFYAERAKDICVSPCTIVSDLEELTINNKTWVKFVYSINDSKILQLFYSNNQESYVLTYTASSSKYNSEINKVEKVYNTLNINND